jgi:hypothetical protein
VTTDVRTLLHDAAEAPSRGPDIAGAQRTARVHRRRRRGLGALVAVVVVALVTGLVALGGGDGDDARVAIGPRQTGSEIPDGWKSVTADPGLRLSIPPEWHSFDAIDSVDGPAQKFLVGTFPSMTLGSPDPCAAQPDGAGDFVRISEYTAGTTEVLDPFNNAIPVSTRPTTFRGRTDLAAHVACSDAAFTEFAFVDEGRVFLAEIMSKKVVLSAEKQAQLDQLTSQINDLIGRLAAPSPTVERTELELQLNALRIQYQLASEQYGLDAPADLGIEVLDTLQVEPLDDTTTVTNTLPVTTMPTSTSAAPFVPTSADEQEIADLVVRWLHYETDDELRTTIQGADSILDAIHEGLSQYQQNLPDGYTGRADDIRIVDAEHADITFTLFLNGGVLYTNRTGHAVKIDGRWMMTRSSECDLLALGNISCPPEP